MPEQIILKSAQGVLEIHILESADFEQAFEEIKQKFSENRSFFEGASHVALMGKVLLSDQKNQIRRVFAKDFKIKQVYFEDELKLKSIQTITRKKENLSGLQRPRGEEVPEGNVQPAQLQKTLFLTTTVRNGQRVESDGSIVVVGDVNPGAELIARENIVVFGKLLGLAHAGAEGDETAFVVANKLKAKQVRIANKIIVLDVVRRAAKAEMASINNGKIVIQTVAGKPSLT